MFLEADLKEPNEYMGYTGPLVKIYEILDRAHQTETMDDSDWTRGEALCELDDVYPTSENMFQKIQSERSICLSAIEDKQEEHNPTSYIQYPESF